MKQERGQRRNALTRANAGCWWAPSADLRLFGGLPLKQAAATIKPATGGRVGQAKGQARRHVIVRSCEAVAESEEVTEEVTEETSSKMKVSELKAKIKEDILSILSEQDEEEDVEVDVEDEVEVIAKR